ncbi:MAG: orotidine-5'-phosphate decarboxylase [Chloroflexi bacterium]|nr:orotidine-5'-phosphate decarboxylase [Chloroflexota bacterium]
MNFLEKLTSAVRKNESRLCIGLDPDPGLMPGGVGVFEFNKAIIDATCALVCAYKPQFAFYEALGQEGMDALRRTIRYIPPEIVIIGDGKRGDIGNTSRAYARALFDDLGCDAATVNPYLGFDSVQPFIDYHEKGVFILCRTSNLGAADFQSLLCQTAEGARALYEIVARKAEEWNKYGNVGLVVGATYPEELKQVRQSHPDMPLLIPGVGVQGGDLALTVRYGADSSQDRMIISSSRQIIYASREKGFALAARRVAEMVRMQINEELSNLNPAV